jgi:hypothetical protein
MFWLNMEKFCNFRKMVASIKPNLPWLSFGVATETLALLSVSAVVSGGGP